ncbi:hypothetical protein FRB90_006289 [Tulasnella sp. 427]|nr:hypothetical protein FRB90_006289 [Tulasnella sp. 427]
MQHVLEEIGSPSRSTKLALATATATTAAYLAYNHFSSSGSHRSSIPTLRGPPSTSLISGNLFLIFDPDIDQLEKWLEEYGNVFAVPGLFGVKGLYLADPKAVAHRLTGPGLVAAEGDVHKRQRRISQPSFSPAQVKQLTPGFVAKSQELKSIWKAQRAEGPTTINVLHGLDHLTLDIIGESALGYDFGSLHGAFNELAQTFEDLLGETATADPMHSIAGIFPSVAKLPLKRNQVTSNALAILRKVGQELIDAKRKDLASLPDGGADELLGQDLLNVLLRSNMKETASQMMSDEEVIAQINTFVIAGHDTTSTSTSWTLYALAKNPQV